jgi:hypothetical protein
MLRDVIISFKGTCIRPDWPEKIPEAEKAYPENRMFGSVLPAYGFFIRHAKNIEMENIRLKLLHSDIRPPLWIEDSENIDFNYFTADMLSHKMLIKKDSKKIHVR